MSERKRPHEDSNNGCQSAKNCYCIDDRCKELCRYNCNPECDECRVLRRDVDELGDELCDAEVDLERARSDVDRHSMEVSNANYNLRALRLLLKMDKMKIMAFKEMRREDRDDGEDKERNQDGGIWNREMDMEH